MNGYLAYVGTKGRQFVFGSPLEAQLFDGDDGVTNARQIKELMVNAGLFNIHILEVTNMDILIRLEIAQHNNLVRQLVGELGSDLSRDPNFTSLERRDLRKKLFKGAEEIEIYIDPLKFLKSMTKCNVLYRL
jgi:hypothetical protein